MQRHDPSSQFGHRQHYFLIVGIEHHDDAISVGIEVVADEV